MSRSRLIIEKEKQFKTDATGFSNPLTAEDIVWNAAQLNGVIKVYKINEHHTVVFTFAFEVFVSGVSVLWQLFTWCQTSTGELSFF